jgi:hypothetical protein
MRLWVQPHFAAFIFFLKKNSAPGSDKQVPYADWTERGAILTIPNRSGHADWIRQVAPTTMLTGQNQYLKLNTKQ